ncbi:MAG: hypothetical protein P9L92_17000 [Candidatus Electryonea clarkiae]|nr:hypothetical protein [Candidatus Electryonea clarkiae]MDP8288214.1 hypothetical protein [Candidatus Electryonea clarkiae]
MQHFSGGRFRELISIDHFLNLSAEINYQLTATEVNTEALLALVLGPAHERFKYKTVIQRAIDCILIGYREQRRHLGPPAVIHPLRTAAILARAIPDPDDISLLGALLHDKIEDIDEEELDENEWKQFTNAYDEMLKEIGERKEWFLHERLAILTRESKKDRKERELGNLPPVSDKEASYPLYLKEIMTKAIEMKELLHIKLTDRLDNTLDTHVRRPGVTRYNFYRTIFDILFVPVYEGVKIKEYHFLPDKDEGVRLLNQLFKNVLFMSLLRQNQLDKKDSTTQALFDALAVASIREAQWIALELLAVKIKDTGKQRALINQIREYCIEGGITKVREDNKIGFLDGTILKRFAVSDKEIRKERLAEIFENNEFLASVTISFIATFSCFLNDPSFYIHGIDQTLKPGT